MQFAVAGLANASVMREGEDMFTLDPSVIISRQQENLSKTHTEVRRGACLLLAKQSCYTDMPTCMQTDLNINGRYADPQSQKAGSSVQGREEEVDAGNRQTTIRTRGRSR